MPAANALLRTAGIAVVVHRLAFIRFLCVSFLSDKCGGMIPITGGDKFFQFRFFLRTIESVLNQTYPHIEYIIMDGCSKDGTVALAQSYREAFDDSNNGWRQIFSVSLFSPRRRRA